MIFGHGRKKTYEFALSLDDKMETPTHLTTRNYGYSIDTSILNNTKIQPPLLSVNSEKFKTFGIYLKNSFERFTETQILGVAEAGLDARPFGVVIHQTARGVSRPVGREAPRLLQAFRVHAHHRPDLVFIGRHRRPAQGTCSSPEPDPVRGRAHFSVDVSHLDVAAKADQIVKLQRRQQLV